MADRIVSTCDQCGAVIEQDAPLVALTVEVVGVEIEGISPGSAPRYQFEKPACAVAWVKENVPDFPPPQP